MRWTDKQVAVLMVVVITVCAGAIILMLSNYKGIAG
jgi:hypothetical protein